MKKMNIQKLCDAAEHSRSYFRRDVLVVEIVKGTATSELSRIRFSRNENGRPTRKIIEVNENDQTRYYDRCVDLDVIALTVNGTRVTV